MASGLPLLLLLATAAPARDPRVELDAVATRIEQLKMRHLAGQDVGRELVALLIRAQELVGEIEGREARAPTPAPAAASELRERADALHDQADRIAAALGTLDARIVHAHRTLSARQAQPPDRIERTPDGTVVARRAALSPLGPSAPPQASALEEEARLRAMLAERARLEHLLAQVRTRAAALEAEARAAER